MYKGNLSQVLKKIGEQLSLPVANLIEYANEAPYAATRPDGNAWPSGTGSISEKRILYAIAKALSVSPQIDLGTRWGAMTTQLITGYPNTMTYTVDIEKFIQGSKQPVGKFISDKRLCFMVHQDCIAFLKGHPGANIGLLFEDTAHTYEMTKAIYDLAPERLMPGGVVISHDAVHPKFKGAVVAGIKAAGIEPNVYLVEGDSCGLAIWQKPTMEDTSLKAEIQHETKIDNEAIKEAPKRRKRRRKKASESLAIEDV